MNKIATGVQMLSWAKDLFPLNRSITGEGTRETLRYLSDLLPELQIKEIETDTQVFDWRVPQEWAVREAYVEDPQGNRVIDFSVNNLHVVGYSIPINRTMPLEELQNHLHSIPDQPNAIPYVTSYYEKNWGFCLTDELRSKFIPGEYKVYIDSDLFDGSMSYGELILPGEDKGEVFLSTYICHPSMANNELSGPVLATALGRWLKENPRRFTYRIVFVPETIGALAFLSRNLESLR